MKELPDPPYPKVGSKSHTKPQASDLKPQTSNLKTSDKTSVPKGWIKTSHYVSLPCPQTGKLGSRLVLVKKKKGVRSARIFRWLNSYLTTDISDELFQLQKKMRQNFALYVSQGPRPNWTFLRAGETIILLLEHLISRHIQFKKHLLKDNLRP